MSTLTCQRCGGDMPPLPDELAAVLRSGQPVAIVHEVCPNETADAAEQTGRYFEVRTQIVEVTPGSPDPLLPGGVGVPEVVEFFDFRHGVRADNLLAAMRPLADGLGAKWLEAEKHAGIADGPAAAGDQS